MISGLWNGITGLNTFEKALATQSNNVSNSNTIGHKSDKISFEDLMYQSRYGKGVTVQAVEKNFSQGGIKVTNNMLDVAIEGDGFFIVKDHVSGKTLYTRAGNFKLGSDGTLESMEGNKILGSTINTNIVSSDGNTQFNSNYTKFLASEPIFGTDFSQTINAKATDYTKSAVDSGVSGQGFKTAASKIADIDALKTDYSEKLKLYASNPVVPGIPSTSQVSQIDFSNANIKFQEGSFIEIYVNGDMIRQNFETDFQTSMNKFADKISDIKGLSATVDENAIVTITSLVPGKNVKLTNAAINSSAFAINEITSPFLGTGEAMVNSSRDALKAVLEKADARFLEITNIVQNADTELTNLNELQLRLNGLGLAEGVFGELSIEDGLIYAKDGNNKFLMGKLETIDFPNPQSLELQGGTFYSIGRDTGKPVNANNLNKIIGGAIELSNTNLGNDLVDLMIYQRAFEASSKSITTSDEFLKTAIQLKK